MLGVHLFLFKVCPLIGKFVEQLLKHFNDGTVGHMRDTVRAGGKCWNLDVVQRLYSGKERINRTLRVEGDKLIVFEAVELNKGCRSAHLLFVCSRLLLDVSNEMLQRIDGLAILLVRLRIVDLLNLSDIGGRLDVALPGGDVRVKVCDLFAKLCRIGVILSDVSGVHLDCFSFLRDVAVFLVFGMTAELLVGCKLDLLLMLLSFALLKHTA